MRGPRFSTAAAAGAALMLSACASNIGAGGIDAATKAQLQGDVQTLTKAAQHHQYSRAQSALSALDADLAAAQATGKATDAKLSQIRASAVKVLADLAASTATPPAVAAPATPLGRASTEQPKTNNGNGNDHGNDHGNDRQGGGD